VKEDEDVIGGQPPRRGPPRPTKTTTAIPIDVTTTSATTRRPPRVKSNIHLAGKQNSGGRTKSKVGQRVTPTTTPLPFAEEDLNEVPPPLTQEIFDTDSITDDRSTDPFRNPPVLSADGKKPRVKSNIKANKALVGAGVGGGNDQEKGRHKVEVATDNIEFVPPPVEDQVSLDGSTDNGPIAGPEVRPDGRPPRVKANIPAKFNGQKDQRTRIPVSTEIPVQFEAATEAPGIPLDFVPPVPNAPEEQPFSAIPKDEIKTDDLFKRPLSAFPTKRPDGPRVKSNILFNQRNKGGSAGNTRSRPKIVIPVEDPRSAGGRVVPANDFETPTSIPPGVQNFLAQVPIVPLEQGAIKPQFIDEIDEFEDPEIEATTFVPPPSQPQLQPKPQPQPQQGHQPRVKSNILANRPNNKFNNRNQPVTRQPSTTASFNSEAGSAENEPASKGQSEDESSCNNLFKCPPARVADGRKPRVKSNIKAVNRNFFVPNTNTNRIKGKVKPDRSAFNQFLTNLKGRKGKASRERSKQTQNSAAPQNELLEEIPEDVQLPTTTTENLLQVLLNQINAEKASSGDEDENFSSPRPPFQQQQQQNEEEDYDVEVSSIATPVSSTRAPFRHSQKRPLPQQQQNSNSNKMKKKISM